MCVAHARDARCKAETLHHPHAIPAQELLDRAEAGSAAVKAVARAASQISSLDKVGCLHPSSLHGGHEGMQIILLS